MNSPAAVFHRPAQPAWLAALAILLVLLPGCRRLETVEEGVRLLHAGDSLEPTSTLELRFDEPVIAAEDVGTRTNSPPFTLEPPLRGTWTWLSRRGGVFRPDEPPALATAYRLRMDHPSGARLARTLVTPPFALQLRQPEWYDVTAVAALPELRLYFNADVPATAAAAFCEFRDAAGRRIDAVVRQARRSDHPSWSEPHQLPFGTWLDRFAEERPPAVAAASSPTGGSAPSGAAPEDPIIGHALVVTPSQPLPAGEGWRLLLRQGLPAAAPGLRLGSDDPVPLGTVQAFMVKRLGTRAGVNSGRRIVLEFTRSLSPEVQSTNLASWITVTPAPTNLVATVQRQTVELAGAFELGQDYEITVRRGLPAREPVELATAFTGGVRFAPLPPRLYLPAVTAEQAAGGRRQFELLSLNLDTVQVRARQLDRHTLVHALRALRSYRNPEPWRDGEYEPFRPLDFNVLPGRTVLDTNLSLPADVDAAVRTGLDWHLLTGGARHGAVFVSADSGGPFRRFEGSPGAQTLVQLTDLGLYWKRSEAQVWVAVFSYETGRPVPGTAVRLVSDDNEELASGATDASGLVTLPADERGAWLVAENGGDLRAAPLAGDEQRLYVDSASVPVRYEYDSRRNGPLEALLFSDRPLYRPGETLHLKALVRERTPRGLEIPSGLEGRLAVFDARDRRFHEAAVTAGALGSWNADVTLPAAVRGTYRAEVRHGTNQTFTHYFEVQDFRPAAFAVSLETPATVAAAEAVRVPVTARYLSGAEVSRATVRWTIEAGDTAFTPAGFDAFAFGAQVWPSELGYGSTSRSLQGETNLAPGQPVVLAPELTPNPKAPQPLAVDLLVELTDLNQQTLVTRRSLVRHSSDFYLGLATEGFGTVGEPLAIEVVAVGADGQPWATPVPARLRVWRVDWRTVRIAGAGGARTYRSEPVLEPVADQALETRRPERDGADWVVAGEAGPAATFTPAAAGQYVAEVTATDPAGRPVLTAVMLYASGAEKLAWNYRGPARLDVLPQSTNHVAGDTALLLLKAPFSGTAVVTVERERVLRSWVTNLTGNAPVVGVPLVADDDPAVFVSVMLLRGRADSPRAFPEPEYALGWCALPVVRPEHHLEVRLAPGREEVRPAEEVVIDAQVVDGRGKPAAGAEVTLYAVDEGVLNLVEFEPPDPAGVFLAVRPLEVFPYCTLPVLLPEDPAGLRFENKGYVAGGGGRDYGPLRRNFQACAFWHATLVTDAAGRLTARFPAPDGLTRYRVFAVAHTAAQQFGRGETAFRVNKPLMLEPATPAFANRGDRLLVRARLMNQTGRGGAFEVRLELDGTAAPDDAAAGGASMIRRLDVAAGAAATVDFPVRFTATGTARWTWRAAAAAPADAAFTDAVETTFAVNDPAPLLREVHLARSGTNTVALLADVGPQLREAGGEVTVRVGNSRLSELGAALDHLLHYPYGCLEQTTSSLLPWLALADLTNSVPALTRPPAEVRAVVERGLGRLWSMQNSDDGGFTYWPGPGASHLWASAYGGLAVALAQRQGYPLPSARVERLYDYLRTSLQGLDAFVDNQELSERCLAAWVLAIAGRPPAAAIERFHERRDRMSAETRATLALAVLETGRDPEAARDLLDLPARLPAQDDQWFGCAAREVAVRLLAWCRLDSAAPELDRLVSELTASRSGGHWVTTQGNAWALLALAEYARRVEAEPRPITATLTWDSQPHRIELPSRPAAVETVFRSEPGRPLPSLTLDPAPPGLFVETTITARARVAEQPRQDRGFALERRYELLGDDNTPRPFAGARPGDRVLVTLEIEARHPGHYVAVEDPLPALLEPVNPAFKHASAVAGNAAADWVSDHRELRADRALFFCNHLPAGRTVLRYLARVRGAGNVIAPAAKIEEMYRPGRFGIAGTQPVEARAAE